MADNQVATIPGKQVVQVEPDIEVVEEGVGVQPGQQVVATDGERATGTYDYPDDDDDRVGNTEDGRATGGAVVTAESAEVVTARQRRRRADRAARERDRAEITRLRQENDQFKQLALQTNQRVANVEISAVDTQIANIEGDIQKADRVIAQAITANNGDDATTAMQIRDTLRDRLNTLKADKARHVEATKRVATVSPPGQVALPPGITQAQVNNFQIFAKRHPWYDVKAQDGESKQAMAIDNELQREGSDPNTAEHWVELEKRIRETMPRYTKTTNGAGDADADGAGKVAANGAVHKPNGGPRLPGTGAGTGAANGAVRFHLSADRKQALIDLGVYGTPDQNKYIKAYMAFDKSQPRKQ